MTISWDNLSKRPLLLGSLAGLALILLATTDASAQVNDMYKFKNYVESDAYLARVEKLVADVPEDVLHRCPAMHLRRRGVMPLKFVSMDANSGTPKNGSWVYALQSSGCDEDLEINLFFEAVGDGKVNAFVGAPGTTKSAFFFPYDDDLKAMAKATELAKAGGAHLAAQKAAGGPVCPQFAVKDTEFKDYGLRFSKIPDPGPDAHFRPWWEYWAVIGCGHRYEMQMEFSPGIDGIKVTQPLETVTEK